MISTTDTTRLRVLLASTFLLLGAGIAPAQDAAVPTRSAVSTLDRRIDLDALGFADGVTMEGLSGRRSFYFPVPAREAVEAMRLVMPYRAVSPLDARRSLRVSLNGTPVGAQPITGTDGDGRIALDVPASAIESGGVSVDILYGGALTGDRCSDERASTAFVRWAPEGGLSVSLRPEALDTVAKVAAAMPAAVDVVLPDDATPVQTAAALMLAIANPDARIVDEPDAEADASGRGWERGLVRLVGADRPALAVLSGEGAPGLAIGGDDPVTAVRLLRRQWIALAATDSVAGIESRMANEDADAEDASHRLTFAELGGPNDTRGVVERDEWTTYFPASAIPAGRRLSELRVAAVVAEDPSGTPAIVSVTMNGQLLGSAEAGAGTTLIDVAVPDALVVGANTVTTAVTREPVGGDCRAEASKGYDAQVLGTSGFTLGSAGEPASFAELGAAFRHGVEVMVPDRAALEPLVPLLRNIVGTATPLEVVFATPDAQTADGENAEDEEGRARIVVADEAPSGGTPPVELGQGRPRLIDSDGGVLVGADGLANLTVAQLLRDTSAPVLWIRPGADFQALANPSASTAEAGALALGRGDVAFYEAGQPTLAFSSRTDTALRVDYLDRATFERLVRDNWGWIVGAGWVLFTLGFLLLLRRSLRARHGR